MSKNKNTVEIIVKAIHYEKPLMLRTRIGEGTLGKTKFCLDSTMGGALYLSIDGKGDAVVLDVQSFVCQAVEILEQPNTSKSEK